MNERQVAWAEGLHQVADFFAEHPELCPPYGETFNIFAHDREHLAEKARSFGTCDKVEQDYWYVLRKVFGPHKVDLTIERECVCTKVQVGTRTVTKPDPEAIAAVPTIEVEEPIYEWECPDSILNPELQEVS